MPKLFIISCHPKFHRGNKAGQVKIGGFGRISRYISETAEDNYIVTMECTLPVISQSPRNAAKFLQCGVFFRFSEGTYTHYCGFLYTFQFFSKQLQILENFAPLGHCISEILVLKHVDLKKIAKNRPKKTKSENTPDVTRLHIFFAK